MKKLYKYKDLFILLLSIFAGISVILIASYRNYSGIQKNIIMKEQQQLLNLSKSISRNIEDFFLYQEENLNDICDNNLFVEQFAKYIESYGEDKKFDSLLDYYIIQKNNIDKIVLIDMNGKVIDGYPKNNDLIKVNLIEDMDSVLLSKEPRVSNVHLSEGKLYIQLFKPVIYKSQIKAIACIQIKLDDIYSKYVKPIKAGEKGYASIKNSRGILLMHPNKNDIGEEVIKIRKAKYPNYDWTELEDIVEKQKQGESGVGSYHSIWYTDEKRERIKKISAYSPCRVGNDFWIVNVSMDYIEMTQFVRDGTYRIMTFNFITILVFVVIMFYVYKIKKERTQYQKEAELLIKVNELNKELEDDIKARKRLETELIKNKEKYELLFNSGNDYILALNLDNNKLPTEFLEANNKACVSLGYDKVDLLKKSYLDISKDSNIEKFKNMVEHIKRHKSIIYEDTLITRDGKFIPVETNAHLFEIDDELKVILISRDITNRRIQEAALKRSEERFRKIINQVATEISLNSNETDDTNKFYSNEERKNRLALELESINIRLEQLFKKEVDENKKKEALMIYQSRLAALGEMIGNIAHQWRQPLSGLGLIIENIYDGYNYQDLSQEDMEQLVNKSRLLIKRMSQTIDDFRYFFNPRSDKVSFSINKNIKYTINFLEERLKLYNIKLITNENDECRVYGYSNYFSQVVFNIIQNAIDALIENRVDDRAIIINICSGNDYHKVTIEDNGGGVDENIIKQVFDPYFTTKEKNKGTGLGLYMTRVIVEKNMLGRITLSNTANGACITIYIPKNGVDLDE